MQRWLIIALKIGITALIMAFFVWQLDLRSAVHALSTISPYAIFAAASAVLAISLAAAARLVLVVAGFGRRFGLGDSYRVTLESISSARPLFRFWAETRCGSGEFVGWGYRWRRLAPLSSSIASSARW
jgi:hypothetical protein